MQGDDVSKEQPTVVEFSNGQIDRNNSNDGDEQPVGDAADQHKGQAFKPMPGTPPVAANAAAHDDTTRNANAQAHAGVLADLLSRPVRGAYFMWVAERNGHPIQPPTTEQPDRQPDPSNPAAEELVFGILGAPGPPPKEQSDLQVDIEKVLRTCQRLYLDQQPARPSKFRIYYTRLFRLAQLGLQGENPIPEAASVVLAGITADLIEDEGGIVKNTHLLRLGYFAGLYAIPLMILYATINLFPGGGVVLGLARLHIDAILLSAFILLWLGCFLGVWLSYGIRKGKLALSDLTIGDEDRLAPHIRLIFAGCLAMILGMLFSLGFIEFRVGTVPLTDLTMSPMLAFLVGAFCGISELVLPASIGSRATTFIQNVK